MMIRNILFILVVTFFVGCSSFKKQEIVFDKPKIMIPKKEPVVKRNKGSLYSMRGSSLFADKKDLQVGDIIQINISEDLKSRSKNKRELTANRNNSLGGGITTPTSPLNRYVEPISKKFNSTFGVGFKTTSSSSDSGESKTQLDETFQTTISAVIQETYQNGNYYIKGIKEMLIEGQKQKIIISGIIRPYDITSDNSIDSTQIANLKLLYDKDGVESDILDTPWGLKLIRAIWPF